MGKELIVRNGQLVDVKTGNVEQDALPINDFSMATKLADNEKAEVEARHIAINRVINEIETILVKESITMAEWGGMLEAFQARDQKMIGKLTIKEIKERSNE